MPRQEANIMSVFRCACGFAADGPKEFGDHLEAAFARLDDIGTDGWIHVELAGSRAGLRICACGFTADYASELDDHLLMVFVTPDGVASDGEKHVLVEPSTREHLYPRTDDE
jgi:hypothetical protein